MNEHDAEDAATMVAWIKKSLNAPSVDQATQGVGYLDAMFQAAILLRGSGFWALVARQLLDDGVINETGHGRWTSGLDLQPRVAAHTSGGQS